MRALEDLAVKVNGGLEAGRVIRTFPNARVRRQVEAAPLCQLLQLVLIHFPLSLSITLKTALSLSLSLFKKVSGPTLIHRKISPENHLRPNRTSLSKI